MSNMIHPDHPVVRAMAEEAAREAFAAAVKASDVYPRLTWEERAAHWQRVEVAAHATLLTDFNRPATRDAWVRWLAANQTDLGDLALNLRRDNPAALEAAVCAALETIVAAVRRWGRSSLPDPAVPGSTAFTVAEDLFGFSSPLEAARTAVVDEHIRTAYRVRG